MPSKYTAVVCGSLSGVSLPAEAATALNAMINHAATIVIGDARGMDMLAQQHLHAAGYRNVTVFHVGVRPRNNVGNWPTVAVTGSYTVRDRVMCSHARYGLAVWNGSSPGTRRNIEQLGRRMKVVHV